MCWHDSVWLIESFSMKEIDVLGHFPCFDCTSDRMQAEIKKDKLFFLFLLSNSQTKHRHNMVTWVALCIGHSLIHSFIFCHHPKCDNTQFDSSVIVNYIPHDLTLLIALRCKFLLKCMPKVMPFLNCHVFPFYFASPAEKTNPPLSAAAFLWLFWTSFARCKHKVDH